MGQPQVRVSSFLAETPVDPEVTTDDVYPNLGFLKTLLIFIPPTLRKALQYQIILALNTRLASFKYQHLLQINQPSRYITSAYTDFYRRAAFRF